MSLLFDLSIFIPVVTINNGQPIDREHRRDPGSGSSTLSRARLGLLLGGNYRISLSIYKNGISRVSVEYFLPCDI